MNSTSAILATQGIADAATLSLSDTGRLFYDKGWSYGTSSNYSIVHSRDPLRILITASGRDKGRLGPDDFTLIDESGAAIDGALPKPSAEALLHVAAVRHAKAGAVLHTHSIWGTLLSDLYARDGGFPIEGYEMLKGLDGINTHQSRKWVEIFDNTQHIPGLAAIVAARLNDLNNPLRHGYLIRGHGLYTWGRNLNEARRHVEVFEFLFEILGRKLSLPALSPSPLGESVETEKAQIQSIRSPLTHGTHQHSSRTAHD